MRWNFLDFKRNELAMQRDSKMKQSLLHPILLAGLAGGLAELVWVMLYSSLTQVSGSEVARQIAVTLFSALAHAPFAAALGVAIHFALSLALAVAFVWIVWRTFIRKRGIAWTFAGAAVALAVIWAANFLVVLPRLNPGFVVLMPYSAALFSKLLFGVAMAWVLNGSLQTAESDRRIAIRPDAAAGDATS
jgi:hypothetical protein